MNISLSGSNLPDDVLWYGEVCTYCFEESSALVLMGCDSGHIYDYGFCGTHVFMVCAQFNQHELQMLPCGHKPLDLIYSYLDGDERWRTFNSDGRAI